MADRTTADIEVRQLPSGYWHIRGRGPCEWAQPPTWPCDEATLRGHAFPEASERFITAVLRIARQETPSRVRFPLAPLGTCFVCGRRDEDQLVDFEGAVRGICSPCFERGQDELPRGDADDEC